MSKPNKQTAGDRFKDWTADDYDREIKRIQASQRRLEIAIPKLKRQVARNAWKAFDPSI